MLRRLSGLLVILAVVGAACGGDNGTDADSATASAPQAEVEETAARPDQPSVGDCFNAPPGEDQGLTQIDEGATSGIEVVPCGSDHEYEVYALTSFACDDSDSIAALALHLAVAQDSLPDLVVKTFYDARWEYFACAVSSSDVETTKSGSTGLDESEQQTTSAESADEAATSTPPPTNTSALPSYEEILATYPADVELCTTEAEVIGQNADGSLQIEVAGGTFVIDGQMAFPCFGMRLATPIEVSLHGTDYPAGSVLVVDPAIDPTALDAGVEMGQAVVIKAEGFSITVGPTGGTWNLAAGAGLIAIDEFVTPTPSLSPAPDGQGSGPLPEPYTYGLSEQEALELAAANGLTARVTVRDDMWLPETDEYVSGRLNFIVEGGLVVDGWVEL